VVEEMTSFADHLTQVSIKAARVRTKAIENMIIDSGLADASITLRSMRLISQDNGVRVDKEFVWIERNS
jgi:hypothetical protein